jgi:hypothetical protein
VIEREQSKDSGSGRRHPRFIDRALPRREEHYDVTLIEKNSRVGGLARTCYYGGHPYEFGPHIWFEVPVLPGAAAYFPRNAIDYALEHNLIAEKAYPQQSAQAFRTYDAYVDRGRKIPNLRYVGRHAEFKYWGMAETVQSAYLKSLEFEPV